jgi:nucleotide-binding universal stress UspA family protein
MAQKDAADYSISIATMHNSELILIQVIPPGVKLGHAWWIFGVVPPKLKAKVQQEAKRSFDKIRDKLVKSDAISISTKIIATDKSIVAANVEYAEDKNIDLIVVRTRGISGFKKLLLGSVASGFVTYAHCPVLVVSKISELS